MTQLLWDDTIVNVTPRLAALLAALAMGWLSCSAACATTWYVSPLGNDSNSGKTSAAPKRHLQVAANATRPGDTVMVMTGTYTAGGHHDVLDIAISGTPSAWITYQAAPGAHPVIDFNGAWAGMQIDAAYIRVSGFEFAGGARSVSLAYATAHAKELTNVYTTASGIVIATYLTGATPHHISIENNLIHDAPGAGIAANFADYLTIDGNVLERNAFWSPYAASAISLWELRDVDGYTGTKNTITRNICARNQEFIANQATGGISDGNGIIIDDNKNTQTNGVAYGGRSYVADNIVYLNGGSGIHAYSSAHVDIVNNTAYLNNQSPELNEGQIFAASASDVNILNNILYAPANKLFTSDHGNDETVISNYNILFSATPAAGRAGVVLGAEDIVANPKLAAPGSANFALLSGSPAIGSGTAYLAPATDFVGHAQPSTMGVSRGAYAYVGPSP
jgi:hypothetical protein